MIHVRELVVALGHAGGAAEVVEGDGGIATLAEAQGELLVEAVEPADVGEHDDADPAGLIGDGREGSEQRAVGCLEGEILRPHRCSAREGRDRRQRIELEAHRESP